MISDASPASRDQALALHKAGKVREAAGMYEALLQKDPADASLWGLLSVAQLRLGESRAAVASWRRGLAAETTDAERLRSMANFLLAMQQKDKLAALRPGYAGPQLDFLDGITVPDWPADVPLGPTQRQIVVSLAHCLAEFGRKSEARHLLASALALLPDDRELFAAAGPVLIAADDPAAVVTWFARVKPPMTAENVALFIIYAAARQATGDDGGAHALQADICAAFPVYATQVQPGQRRLVGVVSPMPHQIPKQMSLMGLHFSSNTPAALAARMNDEFRFMSMFPRAAALPAALARAPRPDLLFNNWVNPERLSQQSELDFISDFIDGLGLPVINHPRLAAAVTRQRNVERLAGIPGLVVPRLLRIVNTPEKRDLLLQVIESQVGFPVIIRNSFGQRGSAMAKIDNPADLGAYLARTGDEQLYAIQYIHNPVAPDAYRKIRAAVIGDELIMLNVYFGTAWNVHRPKDRRNLMSVDEHGKADAFAQKILAAPEEALGKAAMTALHEIRRRTPLDVYGIDFDLLPDGRVLFFEANAAMHLAIRPDEDLPGTMKASRAAYRKLFENPPAPRSR